MDTYDNRATRRSKSCSAALGTDIRAMKLSYTYIRKNACSSFKAFFVGESPFPLTRENSLLGMHKYHWQRSLADIESSDYRIFVYRDPFERCASLYKNKFIQRSGNVDIFNSYSKVTGCDPCSATFDDFIHLYLAKLLQTKLDAHAFPQAWHLFPVEYNAAVLMGDLRRDMAGIIGDELANRYFSRPVNSTRGVLTGPVGDAHLLSADNLRSMMEIDNIMPSTSSFWTSELACIIEDLYRDDYAMIKKICGNRFS